MKRKDIQKLLFISFFLIVSLDGLESKPADFYVKIKRKVNYQEDDYDDDNYSYKFFTQNGPKHWRGYCNTGKSQSPIVYDMAPQIIVKDCCNPLKMIGSYNTVPIAIQVRNNGHGATYAMAFADGSFPQITGGPLGKEVYSFVQFHSHTPCEHKPMKFWDFCDLETHFVHYNTKYKGLTEATEYPDGLAVISVLYSKQIFLDSPEYIGLLDRVYSFNSEYIEYYNLFTYADAIGFTKFPQYVSYKGSLTIPTCSESVTWIIIDDLNRINYRDLNKLRQIQDYNRRKLIANARPVQPINNRTVLVYNEL